MATAFSDLPATLTVSPYKWLTNALVTAQQSYVVRPFFKAKVVDDTVSFSTSYNRPPNKQGSWVTAPDGSLLAVGLDASNNVVFYKAYPNTNFSFLSWDVVHQLEASGGTFANAQNRFTIAVSDMVNGSYHIDIYYFVNFVNSGASLQVKSWSSDDGGSTWSSFTFSPTMTQPSSHYDAGYGGIIPNLSLAALKPRLINGNIFNGFAYLDQNNTTLKSGNANYDIGYTYGSATGGGFNNAYWSPRNANSADWSLHSLDSYYLNGVDYIVFSGFRNYVDSPNTVAFPTSTPGGAGGNFGLYVTGIPTITGVQANDLWTPPISVFNSQAVTFINQNLFTFPTATVINGVAYITFRAQTVDSYSPSASGSNSTIVTTHLNYMVINTTDSVSFTYPSIIVDGSGNEFNDSGIGGAQRNVSYTDFPGQSSYWLGGGQTTWQFIQNNTVADVSGDVIQYTIQDVAGQPSSVSLQIANQNNVWVGSSPTNPGASAISKNKKIVIQQGYYTDSTHAALVPRNVYYIDDINQNVSNTSNDVTLSGRDLYKKLKTLVSKYTYAWIGPWLYTDIFDGSTLANWNQQVGNWVEQFLLLTLTAFTGGDDCITLSNVPTITYGSNLVVGIIPGNSTGEIHVYGLYIDSSNWLRVKFDMNANTWTVERKTAGTITSFDSGSLTLAANTQYGVVVRQYDWYKFNFMIQTGTGVTNGYNGIGAFTGASGNLTLLASGTNGEYNMAAYIPANDSTRWTVGVGSKNMVPGFRYFKYAQYNNSNNVAELIKAISTKASVFNYNIQQILSEYFFTPSLWSGSARTFANRSLQLTGGGNATNYTGQQFANGEIVFRAKIVPNTSADYNFQFVFRNDLSANQYRLNIRSTSGAVHVAWSRLFSGFFYDFPQTSFDANTGTASLGPLNIDLTKVNTYKVVFFDGWMLAFINGIMVGAWNDNTTSGAYLTTGYIGFANGSSNATLYVYSVTSTAFWKQAPTFSINPGDDMETDTLSVVQSVRSWFFSDLFGYLKAIFLNSTDPTTYTYQNQLYAQGVDQSDKEYVSQVTVYGTGVSATARATTLMAGVAVREEVIVDSTITTAQDAQTRANNELINANQYQAQYDPKQTMNVGAELFDVVTIVNTGNNSSGVNGTTRTYAQKLTTGGQNNEYSVELNTGNL